MRQESIKKLKRGKKIKAKDLVGNFIDIEASRSCEIVQSASRVDLASDPCGCFASWVSAFFKGKRTDGHCKHGVARLIKRFYLPDMKFRKIKTVVDWCCEPNGTGMVYASPRRFEGIPNDKFEILERQYDLTKPKIKVILEKWRQLMNELNSAGAPPHPFGTARWQKDPSSVIQKMIELGFWK